jgi:hypothetical protein
MMKRSPQTAEAARSRVPVLKAPIAVLSNAAFWFVLAWNVLVLNPAMGDQVQPFVEPKLLYSLDEGQMSVADLVPGATDPAQLEVYLSMLGEPLDPAAALADPTLVLMAAMNHDALYGGEDPAMMQTAAGFRGEPGLMPRSYMGADGVWEFPRLPDADERDMLVGEKWRVVESVESQILFLGPDRQFGFDDFLDIVNPLQHIPLVNVAYRALSGDEIYGAARLFDVGFGPVAGVSTVFDLAYTSTTGASMEDQAIAAVFGPSADDVAELTPAEADQLALRTRRGSNQ